MLHSELIMQGPTCTGLTKYGYSDHSKSNDYKNG